PQRADRAAGCAQRSRQRATHATRAGDTERERHQKTLSERTPTGHPSHGVAASCPSRSGRIQASLAFAVRPKLTAPQGVDGTPSLPGGQKASTGDARGGAGEGISLPLTSSTSE